MAKSKTQKSIPAKYVLYGAGIILLIVLIVSLNSNSQNQQIGTRYVCSDGSSVSDSSLCPNYQTQSIKQPYCGDGICSSNEVYPLCNDCKPKIKLYNVGCSILKAQPPYIVDQLRINYSVENQGDAVYVYPYVQLYAGWSDSVCGGGKGNLGFYKDWFTKSGIDAYLLNSNIFGKNYDETAFGINDPNSPYGNLGNNPKCFYFKFSLKSYNPKTYSEYEILDTYESQLNPC